MCERERELEKKRERELERKRESERDYSTLKYCEYLIFVDRLPPNNLQYRGRERGIQRRRETKEKAPNHLIAGLSV